MPYETYSHHITKRKFQIILYSFVPVEGVLVDLAHWRKALLLLLPLILILALLHPHLEIT
jgi:hypothetical protein